MQGLIQDYFVERTRQLVADGALTVSTNRFKRKDRAYIERIVTKTNALLAIDIQYLDRSPADIVFHRVGPRFLAQRGYQGYSGVADFRADGGWDLFINRNTFGITRRYLLWHEFGHSLGLEHPFDAFDGDYIVSANPFDGLDTDDTVLAYKFGKKRKFQWRRLDRDTLTGIWGAATSAA